MKIVIAEPKTGKSYQTEIDDNKSKPLYGIRIGKEIDGSLVGLIGYKLVVTGGTDKDGFPMRTDVHGTLPPIIGIEPQEEKKKEGEDTSKQ